MIKIIFFDVDGTLLRMGEKNLSEKTLYALKALKKKGILLCMATGRSYPEIPHFDGVDFDILSTFNGSYIVRDEDIIYKNPLNNTDKNMLLQNLKKMNRAIAISNENIIIANGTDPDLEQYFLFGNVELTISDKFDEISKGEIYQVMCSGTCDEYDTILKGCRNSQITAWWDKAVDIIPLNGGKGNAVNVILSYYGLAKEEALAFGDGENDIEMLEAVGTGVAMGNAKDNVKTKANAICKSVEEDGIYYYCVENNLIESIENTDNSPTNKIHKQRTAYCREMWQLSR